MFKKKFEPSPLCPHSKVLTRSNHHFMTQLGWGVRVGKNISMVKKFMQEVNIMWIEHHVKFDSWLFFWFYDVIKMVIIHKMN